MGKELLYLIEKIIDDNISKENLLHHLNELLSDEISRNVKTRTYETKKDKVNYLESECNKYKMTVDEFLYLQAYRNIDEYLEDF